VDETEVISELYALPLADFTRVRNDLAAQAKRQGRKQLAESIKGLRKPTASAWAVNMLVRHHPEEINSLLEIGAQLREAQSSLAGDALRDLTKQRRLAIAALGRQAKTVAARYGQKLSSVTESEVEETLQASLVDPAAGYALRSGRLTAPLSYVGLGPLSAVAGPPPTADTEIPKPAGTSITATWPEGESGLIWPVPDRIEVPEPEPATAPPPPRQRPAPAPARDEVRDRREEDERRRRERDELEQARRRRELTEAHQAQEDAERRAADTAVALDEAQAKAEAATARRVELDRRVDELHEELRAAEEAAMRAAKDVLEARHARDSAARADLVARRAVERSRAEVERLEG
jgi:hypothetical protein